MQREARGLALLALASLLLAAAMMAGAVAAQALFDPVSGYRIAQYRGPVPAPPEGVARITPRDLARLVEARGALLIDVAPAEGGRRDAGSGQWTLAAAHPTIPGAHWFPEAGRGALDPAIAAHFDAGVSALVRTAPQRRLVVFCYADCWMSWNAALRLNRQGYRVAWAAEGSDGWRELGRRLVPAVPFGNESE